MNRHVDGLVIILDLDKYGLKHLWKPGEWQLKAFVIRWLSAPGITDSVNKCRVFGGIFMPKLLATLTFFKNLSGFCDYVSSRLQHFCTLMRHISAPGAFPDFMVAIPDFTSIANGGYRLTSRSSSLSRMSFVQDGLKVRFP